MFFINWIKEEWAETRSSFSKNIKRIVLSAPFWITACALFLIIFFGIRAFTAIDARKEQNMAEFWGSGSKVGYRQMTVFAKGDSIGGEKVPPFCRTDDTSLQRSDVDEMRGYLQGIVNSSMGYKTNNSQSNELKGWEDCYSTFLGGTAYRGDLCREVEVYGVGGNFKAFHPFEYLSGGFLPEVPVDVYQCVINDTLAWELYSAYNVTGETIELYGKTFTIVGVVRENQGSIDKVAGTNERRVYVYFSALEEMVKNGTFGENMIEGYTPAILCYEAFLPETVKGVARTDMLNAIPRYSAESGNHIIVSNTGRFGLDKIVDNVLPLGEYDKKTEGFIFPYWENASLLTIEKAFIDYVLIAFGILLLMIGIISAVLRSKKTLIPYPSEFKEIGDADDDYVSISDGRSNSSKLHEGIRVPRISDSVIEKSEIIEPKAENTEDNEGTKTAEPEEEEKPDENHEEKSSQPQDEKKDISDDIKSDKDGDSNLDSEKEFGHRPGGSFEGSVKTSGGSVRAPKIDIDEH